MAWLWNIQGIAVPVAWQLDGKAIFAQNRTIQAVQPVNENGASREGSAVLF
jgi:hypothetical protein